MDNYGTDGTGIESLRYWSRPTVAMCQGLGIRGGGNVLLHLATEQPHRVKTMVLVSPLLTSHRRLPSMMGNYPNSSLSIIPDNGHGPVLGERWPIFLKTDHEFFLR